MYESRRPASAVHMQCSDVVLNALVYLECTWGNSREQTDS